MTLAMTALSLGAQTLAECQQAAERNYPLVRQTDLIRQTTGLTLENIQRGWLPQISATAQATLQSDVTAFPDALQSVYQQLGIDMKGLRKDQYRLGIDAAQTLYDGGSIRLQKEVARRQGDVSVAENEVSLYTVRKRVNEMYFGLLLLDEQIAQNKILQEVLNANEQKLAAMFKHGTAAQSDYLAVKAERMGAAQQLTNLKAQRQTLLNVLSAFCGIEVSQPSKPEAEAPLSSSHEGKSQRPELRLIDARLNLANAQEKTLDAAIRPRLSLFAQAFYGYPGFNLFEDMMKRRWTLNGMVGARLTWNIGALYTRRNDKAKLQLQRLAAENSRDVFLFNNRLEQMQHSENIERFRKLLADDAEIINLRTAVRKATESKLAHGIIDANDLVKEINSENSARVQQSVHEIQMLKEMYDLKYATNQ